jgi:hypothetical protein
MDINLVFVTGLIVFGVIATVALVLGRTLTARFRRDQIDLHLRNR